jgi:DNA-binding XRE family transcriptional regulator
MRSLIKSLGAALRTSWKFFSFKRVSATRMLQAGTERRLGAVMRRIRQDVFGVTQVQFADIAEVSQAQVSRWESGVREPNLDQLKRIRAEARRRGLKWNDSWFFEEIAA